MSTMQEDVETMNALFSQIGFLNHEKARAAFERIIERQQAFERDIATTIAQPPATREDVVNVELALQAWRGEGLWRSEEFGRLAIETCAAFERIATRQQELEKYEKAIHFIEHYSATVHCNFTTPDAWSVTPCDAEARDLEPTHGNNILEAAAGAARKLEEATVDELFTKAERHAGKRPLPL